MKSHTLTLFATLAALLPLLAAGCGGGDAARFRVLFSSDLRGYVDPCT